jgi:hypothetical protein
MNNKMIAGFFIFLRDIDVHRRGLPDPPGKYESDPFHKVQINDFQESGNSTWILPGSMIGTNGVSVKAGYQPAAGTACCKDVFLTTDGHRSKGFGILSSGAFT